MSTSPTPRPKPIILNEHTIVLTDKERLIFGRLLQVVRHYSLETKLRVAGGWVRDKVCDCLMYVMLVCFCNLFVMIL